MFAYPLNERKDDTAGHRRGRAEGRRSAPPRFGMGVNGYGTSVRSRPSHPPSQKTQKTRETQETQETGPRGPKANFDQTKTEDLRIVSKRPERVLAFRSPIIPHSRQFIENLFLFQFATRRAPPPGTIKSDIIELKRLFIRPSPLCPPQSVSTGGFGRCESTYSKGSGPAF